MIDILKLIAQQKESGKATDRHVMVSLNEVISADGYHAFVALLSRKAFGTDSVEDLVYDLCGGSVENNNLVFKVTANLKMYLEDVRDRIDLALIG